jgi:hypothetical protein
MLRVTLTRGYFRSARRLVPRGSSTGRKVAAALKALEIEPVPSSDDAEDLIPPVRHCFTRRVAGTALALMFIRDGDEVKVLAIRMWP